MKILVTGGAGFGGGGSDRKISGGGKDEGRLGDSDSSGAFFPDAGS